MKLLVFAHTPPPHHGQSYMVQLMLNAFGGDCRRRQPETPNRFGIECYHINARFSKSIEDIGALQSAKLFLILFFCFQAIWCRFRYGVKNFYYIPAPGKRVALYRDWLVMLICRPFFKNIILHWHAAGLAKWLETVVQINTRALTYRLFKPVDLSIVLSQYNFADAEKLLSRIICVVHNGIPDPCPNFSQVILPRRRAGLIVRKKILNREKLQILELARAGNTPQAVTVLFLAHCTREKGLFATIEAIAIANQKLTDAQITLRMKLNVGGNFVTEAEQMEFHRREKQLAGTVKYLGFVSDAEKERALREADLFCFPTCYLGENQPVNLIEAMAFGLPIVTTRWRSLPEMLPPDYAGLVSAKQNPEEIADALLKMLGLESGENLRENFLNRFTLEHHLQNLAQAIRRAEN